MTVACVFRSGGVYTAEWVAALRAGVEQHLPGVGLAALSDAFAMCPPRRPLEHNWPGWWSKMELFRPGLFRDGELVLYIDLDSLIVGDLSELATYKGDLALLSDFYRPERAQSGVMLFRAGSESVKTIWHRWMREPDSDMLRYAGDGQFLHAIIGFTADRIQTLYPGQVVSLRLHAKDGPPPGARIVCAHGEPKMNQPAAGWAHDEWLKWVA